MQNPTHGNELPKHWQIKKLGEVCKIVYGKGLSTKELKESGYPVYGANGIIGCNDKYLYEEAEVLISCRGVYSGKINFSPSKCYVTNNSLILEINDKKQLDKKFLYHILHTVNKTKLVTGTAQPQVTINNAVELSFSLPPLPEQQLIVSKIEQLLSELEKGKQQLETAQQQLKVYRQSLLKFAFEGKLTNKKIKEGELPKGWEWKELKNVVERISDGPFGSNLKSIDYVEKGVRVIRLENIGELEFKDEYKTFVTKEKYETIKRHTVSKGDIIFSSFILEKIRTVILPDYIDKAINKADCFLIRTSESTINKKYLVYYFSTKAMHNQLVGEIHGATRPRINTTQLKATQIPVAPLTEQTKIVSEIESRLSVCNKIEDTISESLLQAEALRQSILKKAFEGKLVKQETKTNNKVLA
ncbi:MAG: restriction endonuclease subunit S [Bacteroidota bacterium]